MKELIPITAVVLAAGTSSRMRAFKPLLPIDGIPMLEKILTKVLCFDFIEVFAVIGYKEHEIRETIHIQDQRFKWISNHQYFEGLSTSLKAAIRHNNNETLGIMVFLGDQPKVKKSTIDQMLKVIMEKEIDQSKVIIQPIFNGSPGHPVFISSPMLPLIKTIAGDQGAKPIFKFADKHIHIPIDDEGIILDVDTKQDYQNVINHPENS